MFELSCFFLAGLDVILCKAVVGFWRVADDWF